MTHEERRWSYDFVARIGGDGPPGTSGVRALLKPASSNQLLISLKLKVSLFMCL
jgi:hypothetical protein